VGAAAVFLGGKVLRPAESPPENADQT
jgi:hypothetical protein